MSYRKYHLLLALFTLLPARLPAAVLDYAPPLQDVTVNTTPVPATTVIYSVFDPALGIPVQSSDNTGQVQGTPRNVHGVVAWSNGSQVFCRVYEPLQQAWVKTNATTGATTDLTTAHGVVAWSVPGAVFLLAWDRTRQTWVASSTAVAGSVSSLQTMHGHATWQVGTRVYYRAYDVVTGQWTGDSVALAGSTFDLTTRDGAITWSVNVGLGQSDIYMVTYDPARAAWGQAAQRTGNTFDLKTDHSVVAWSANASGAIYCFAYDPAQGLWVGNVTVSGSTQNLNIQGGTVFWSANTFNYVRGYNAHNGLWTNSFTVPYAAFGVHPTQGNAPLITTFYDRSLGGSSWSWSFGDGTVGTRRSPTHVYKNYASNYVQLSLLGPGGGPVPAGRGILSDVTPPTGTLLINGGAVTTTNENVHLTLTATDNSGLVATMRFSNNAATWSSWEPYATNKSWTLEGEDGDKTVFAQFQDGTGNLSSAAQASIELDTTPIPAIEFAQAAYSVGESEGSLEIQVRLSNAFGSQVAVDYTTVDGTAVAGEDYVTAAGRLTFVPGQVENSFMVAILPDAEVEPNQTLTLSLSNPTNGVAGDAATVTILDDDAPYISFAASTYSAVESSGTALVQVVLSAASGQSVSVRYATTNGTATVGTDYQPASGTLVFAPNQTVQSFPITLVDNSTDEPTETVDLVIYDPVNGQLQSPTNAVLQILDDDPPSVHLVPPTLKVTEGSGTALLSARLSKPFGETIFVDVVTSNDTAQAGLDFAPLFTTLIFGPGQTNKPLSITLLNDTVAENTETFIVSLESPVVATLGDPAQARVHIQDDEAPRFTSQGINGLGRFEATITGSLGDIFLMQASTNFVDWFPLELLTNVNGTVLFIDPSTDGYRDRHYRVRLFDP